MRWLWLVLGVALLAGCAEPAPAAPAPPTTTASIPVATVPDATPTRVRIPAIGVDSAIIDIAVDGSGALVPPEGPDVTGWYAAGPSPGAVGPALLAGHVDSRSGPAVFYRLRELSAGSRVEVDLSDGSTAAFTVRRTFQTPKAAFPTDAVYAPTPAPELRLVTCGGSFDRAVRSYRDNVVVEAVAVGGTWTITP